MKDAELRRMVQQHLSDQMAANKPPDVRGAVGKRLT